MFKPALEAFSLGHELFCSQNHLVKSATLNMQKSGDVEVSQGKGGGVGREESPSSSPSFTLTPTPRWQPGNINKQTFTPPKICLQYRISLFLRVCDCAVYVCSKYYIRWINRGTVWKVVHKRRSWTFLENFYIYTWPFIHCLCFSNTHKNCIAVKLHLYKYWLEGRGVIKGAGVLRMPLHHPCTTLQIPILHHNTGVKLLSDANCLISPLPSSRSNPWNTLLKRHDSMVFISALCVIHQGWLTAQQQEK